MQHAPLLYCDVEIGSDWEDKTRPASRAIRLFVERQPPCPRATTILAGFQAAEVGVSFNVSG